jgi:glycosyltransferase involved in cell wall biosynthesis
MNSVGIAGRLISVVIPVHNENDSLQELAGELLAVAASHSLPLEIVFVDDGSTDGSWKTICALAAKDSRMRGIRFRRNFGKAAALAAGFQDARGQVVFQMDADLQDDPAELPRFLSRLQSGVDVVNGWKRTRHDPWHRVWSSRAFNWMVSRLTGLRLHDHNCGFKCLRADVVKELKLYGEMHRFIPVIGFARGYCVEEMEVRHRPRRHGRSNYDFRRIPKGFLDLMTVAFLTVFGRRPLHLLGGVGLVPFCLGGLGLTYLAVQWLLARLGLEGYGPIGQRPLLLYSVAGVLSGLHLLSIGFLAELLLALNIRHVDSFSVLDRT